MAPHQHGTLVIRDAQILQQDAAGLAPASVFIEDGVVSRVLPADAPVDPAVPVVEAAGRVLMPGFVDAHSHAEGAHGRESAELGLLRQGVTSAILGQDGISFAPTSAASAPLNEGYFSAINGPLPEPLRAGCTVTELLDHYSTATRFNSAFLAPAGTIRSTVTLFEPGPLTDTQLDAVELLARQAVDEGAAGLSLGLEYVPNGFADQRELLRYARVAADTNVPLVAHMRGYEQSAPGGLDEMLGLARATGAAIHISHLHAPAELVLPTIDAAIASGIDLTFDSYPYRRGNTILAMLALPTDLQQGGTEHTLAALTDPEVRTRLTRDWLPSVAELLTRVTISSAPHPDWHFAEGLTVPAAAATAGDTINNFVLDLLIATRLGAGAIVQQPASNRLDDVRAIANHRAHLGGSDGIFLGGHPHPRGWGSFSRMLARHVCEWGDWSWADAADHLSYRAAARFGLGDRGRARPGSIADFCLIDPETVADSATYERPTAPSQGIMEVLVAGVLVLSRGALTSDTPGQGLRRHEWSTIS